MTFVHLFSQIFLAAVTVLNSVGQEEAEIHMFEQVWVRSSKRVDNSSAFMSKTQARSTQAEIQTLCNTGPHGYLDVGFAVWYGWKCWRTFYHPSPFLSRLCCPPFSFSFILSSLFHAFILQERSKFPSQSHDEQFINYQFWFCFCWILTEVWINGWYADWFTLALFNQTLILFAWKVWLFCGDANVPSNSKAKKQSEKMSAALMKPNAASRPQGEQI